MWVFFYANVTWVTIKPQIFFYPHCVKQVNEPSLSPITCQWLLSLLKRILSSCFWGCGFRGETVVISELWLHRALNTLQIVCFTAPLPSAECQDSSLLSCDETFHFVFYQKISSFGDWLNRTSFSQTERSKIGLIAKCMLRNSFGSVMFRMYFWFSKNIY